MIAESLSWLINNSFSVPTQVKVVGCGSWLSYRRGVWLTRTADLHDGDQLPAAWRMERALHNMQTKSYNLVPGKGRLGLAGRAHSDGGASGGHSGVGLLPPTDQPRHYSDTDVGPPVVMAKIRWSGHN